MGKKVRHETDASGLICAYVLDGKGGGKNCGWSDIRAWTAAKGPLWVHLDYTGGEVRDWLQNESGIDGVTCAGLLADDPRPRCVTTDAGMMLIVRGVNMNEGAEPEDMVSMRIFVTSQRVVTLRHRRNNAAKAVRKEIEAKRGPKRIGAFLVTTIDHLLDAIALFGDQLDDEVAGLEDMILSSEDFPLRHKLAEARRDIIALRRHVGPERDVLAKMATDRVSWFTEVDRAQMREMADRMTRIIEGLDMSRDRAAVTQEEVQNRLSELMNRRLYVLSILTAIFLPMSFITSMLGVNVGGVPLQHHPTGFVFLTGGMLGLLAVLLGLFRVLKWI
jgi:zinc transporter